MIVGVMTLVALLGAVMFPTDRRGVRLAALVAVVGAALMFVVLYERPKFEPRHLMPLAPAVWLLVAVGIRDMWRTAGSRPASGDVADRGCHVRWIGRVERRHIHRSCCARRLAWCCQLHPAKYPAR